MTIRRSFLLALMILLLQACASGGGPSAPTLAVMQKSEQQKAIDRANPNIRFKITRDQVIKGYRDLVKIAPTGEGHGREVQRLADLELEAAIENRLSNRSDIVKAGEQYSQQAINRYQSYLKTYPDRSDNDRVLYQLARAYAMDSRIDESTAVMEQLVKRYPQSPYIDEVQFRLGENLFVEGDFFAAEVAYGDVVKNHPRSIYFEKSLYKFGWSQFKQGDFETALDSFMKLLDRGNRRRQIQEIELSSSLSRSNQELINDVLRVVSLSFSYLDQQMKINDYFTRVGGKPYEPLLYLRLGELYMSKQRITDAADIYIAYGENHPNSPFAPVLHSRAIDTIKKAGFSNLLLTEKENFIRKYNKGTAFWEEQDQASQNRLQPILTGHMFDVSTHYHAVARASKKSRDYQRAADSYQRYLQAFPKDKKSAEINFLLAEALFDSRRYEQAIAEYEKTAYQYPPHENSAEAGYAAIIAYNTLYKETPKNNRPSVNDRLMQSSLRFSESFANDKRMPTVLMKTIEQFFDLRQYDQAQQNALRLVDNEKVDANTRNAAWIIIAHSHFHLKRYADAEEAYKNVLKGLKRGNKKGQEMREQLALSIYRQGELARQQSQHKQAAEHFLRVGKTVPESSKRVVAEYDAATEFVTLKEWSTAISLLEGFRKKYRKQKKWQQGVGEKLALAYASSGQHAKSASEMMNLLSVMPEQEQREMMWQAAELYNQAGQQKQAIGVYKSYIKKYPSPLSRAMELRHKIASYYHQEKDSNNHHYWLKEIIKADGRGGKERSDRSRYLAANATLELVKPVHQSFSRSKLTVPLKKSLDKKKKLMQTSIDAYTRAAKYQVEEVTNAATFGIAEIYREFAVALLKSERPRNLNEDELEEYNYLLEDQAYPFEEKAINIHEKNITRIPSGSWDDSIQSSLKVLGELLPFRYAKNEVTEAFVDDGK